jgi:hypothetical protein
MDRRIESFYNNKTSQKRIFFAVLLETVETSVIIVNDGSQTPNSFENATI